MGPMMADCELVIMRSLLWAQRPLRVLEWGAGDSTVYWPGQCPWLGEWVAIEHDVGWYERLKGEVDGCVDLRLVSREEYYEPLLSEAREYDLVIVDGLYRRCCLLVATEVVAWGGIVVLHDAGREEYKASWGVYPNHEVLYRGELPSGVGGGYLHRGLCVFWGVWDVRSEDWCRDYIV